MNVKTCLECNNSIKGRSDKRFCDDACRNAYHNRRNSEQYVLVRKINALLRKNRNILSTLLENQKMVKVSKETLQKSGFAFDYFTHHMNTSKGHCYVFVYEYGYLPLAHGQYLIVKKRTH